MRILLRFWRLLLGALWLGGVALLTLRGGRVEPEWLAELPRICAICGSRGTADVILNVVLFVPLGLVFGGLRWAVVVALVSGLAVSAGIELLQTLLPGRHPSPADVILNAAGAGLGTALFGLVTARSKVAGTIGEAGVIGSVGDLGPAGRTRLSQPMDWLLNGWSWGAAIGTCFLVAGILLTPAPTDDDYWGQWMPDLGSMPQYEGTVLSAELNGRAMPSRRLDHERPHRSLLEGDWRLEGRIIVGPKPRGVSPILSVYDGHEREVLLLGAHRDALVLRQRRLASRLRFDVPDVRISGAFGSWAVGDTTALGARRDDGTICLWVSERRECGLGVTAGRTWGLLLYVEESREPFRRLVDLLWLTGLFLPVGFFAGGPRDLLGGSAIGLGGLLASTVLTPMILGPWWEVTACLAGVALGRLALVGLRWTKGQAHAVSGAAMVSNA